MTIQTKPLLNRGYVSGRRLGHERLPAVWYSDNWIYNFTAERVMLLDGVADCTATKAQIEAVGLLLDRGKNFTQIAKETQMREVDVVLIGLHLYTENKTGRVSW